MKPRWMYAPWQLVAVAVSRLVRLGFFWWRGGPEHPWQVVEVFEQRGVIMVGRIARGRCWPLAERGGEWGIMIPHPSVKGYCQAAVTNMLGGALACIEAPHAWVCSRMQRDRPSCRGHKPYLANQPHPSRSILADWLGLGAVLPFGRYRCKCDQEEIVGRESSCFLANVQEHAPPLLKSDCAETEELHGGCCVSSCSFSSSLEGAS